MSLVLFLFPPTPAFLEKKERRRERKKGDTSSLSHPPAPLYRGFGNEEHRYAGWDAAGRGGGFIAPEGMGLVNGAGDIVTHTRVAGYHVWYDLSRWTRAKRTAANGVSDRSSGTRELGRPDGRTPDFPVPPLASSPGTAWACLGWVDAGGRWQT